jgi:hypothetical protein
MKKRSVHHYLIRAEQLGVEPNFFMSEPYLQLSNVRVEEKKGWIWLTDKRWCLFPPLPMENPGEYPDVRIWALFKNDTVSLNGHYSFLDWQYVFDPNGFQNMTGKHWQVFRKNCRKWSKNNPGWKYENTPPSGTDAGMLIADWLERKGGSALDPELLARFAYFEDDKNIFRKFLYNKEGELMAINAWDENWKYINYRICIVNTDQPFLDEFVRWLFYTDLKIRRSGKFVNDGGTLDSPGLERFKDKMNPIEKIPLYSWIK